MKKMKWKILLVVGLLPFLIALIGGLSKLSTGFLGDAGADAFWSWVVLCSFIYWPAYVVGFILIILSAAKLLVHDAKEAESTEGAQ